MNELKINILKGSIILGNKNVKGNLTIDDKRITGSLVLPKGINYDTYEGDYIVIPKVYSQILETNKLLMKDDVTVKEITYSVTQNEKGLTVQIGEI